MVGTFSNVSFQCIRKKSKRLRASLSYRPEIIEMIDKKYNGLWPLACVLLAVLGLSSCKLAPETKEAKFLAAGRKELELRNYARALIHFQNAVSLKKTDAEPYYQLGLAYFGTGDYAPAYLALQKAL